MSLVGPRADLVEQAANYTRRRRGGSTVLPGITGWAQVHGRDALPWKDRFAMDLWYIDHWSLWLDLKIVFMTFGELFRPEPEPIEDELNIERRAAPPTRASSERARQSPLPSGTACSRSSAAPTRTSCAPTSRARACSSPASPVPASIRGDVVLACIVRADSRERSP